MASDTLSLSAFYHQFPKADLHYHLLGGVRLETMLLLPTSMVLICLSMKRNAITVPISTKAAW
ncbi:adenosine deaminase [Photobacterium aphoticum]|uniref:Adenosine deaminase n=1 Tax=Photobacterium aphoticum TaxID=754436 RepID=A0A090QK85_9GAMM|nr:adenosine deaminase [Photobacterium aphoticum]